MRTKFLNNYLAVIALMVLFTAGAIIVANTLQSIRSIFRKSQQMRPALSLE